MAKEANYLCSCGLLAEPLRIFVASFTRKDQMHLMNLRESKLTSSDAIIDFIFRKETTSDNDTLEQTLVHLIRATQMGFIIRITY